MSLISIIDFLKGLGITKPIYPLAFPSSSEQEAMIVQVGKGFSSRGSVKETTLSVTVRAGHPSRGEKEGQNLIDELDNLTNQDIGGLQAIVFKTQQLVPEYLGIDSEGNHFFIADFKVLVSD